MLEEVAERLIGALDANTAALLGKAPKGAAAAPAPAKTNPGKITPEMVLAALVKVKDAHGKPAALKIIREAGGAAEAKAIKPARYAAVIEACDEAMGDGTTDEQAEDPDEL